MVPTIDTATAAAAATLITSRQSARAAELLGCSPSSVCRTTVRALRDGEAKARAQADFLGSLAAQIGNKTRVTTPRARPTVTAKVKTPSTPAPAPADPGDHQGEHITVTRPIIDPWDAYDGWQAAALRHLYRNPSEMFPVNSLLAAISGTTGRVRRPTQGDAMKQLEEWASAGTIGITGQGPYRYYHAPRPMGGAR